MNERILELTNIWANRRAEDEKLGIVYTFSEPALKQFAELIIKECIGVAEANMNDILDQPVFNPTDELWNRARVVELTRFNLQIKKHFGVEE